MKNEKDGKNDVIGIANLLMDVLIQTDDKVVKDLGLKKGAFTLIDDKCAVEIESKIKLYKRKIMPGGSVPNTLAGIANLGGTTALIGTVGDDEFGKSYIKETEKSGTKSLIQTTKGLTGIAITLITPDTQRTFAVNYGVTLKTKREIIPEEEITKSKILHTSGYAFEGQNETVMYLAEIAKKNNVKISIDLADPHLIQRNKEKILKFIKEYADIVFANEVEAKALTGKEPEEAVQAIESPVVIVKIGKIGSIICSDGAVTYIPGVKANAVDTTGAGDMYAAGFLYGITHGKTIEEAGNIGSRAAAKVVEVIGARLEKKLYKF